MCVVALSCDCGERAAGRYRWQYSGAHRCEPPLSTWLKVGSAVAPGAQQGSDRWSTRWWPANLLSSTPRHCRSCRPGRNRSAERSPPETSLPSPAHRRSGTGTCPARCWPSTRRRVSRPHPTDRCRCCRRGPRTPIPPRSVAVDRPNAVGRRIGIGDLHHRMVLQVMDSRCPDRTDAASRHVASIPHRCRQSRRSTGPWRRTEHQRAGNQIGGIGPGEQRGIEWLLGDGDIVRSRRRIRRTGRW